MNKDELVNLAVNFLKNSAINETDCFFNVGNSDFEITVQVKKLKENTVQSCQCEAEQILVKADGVETKELNDLNDLANHAYRVTKVTTNEADNADTIAVMTKLNGENIETLTRMYNKFASFYSIDTIFVKKFADKAAAYTAIAKLLRYRTSISKEATFEMLLNSFIFR